MIMKKIRRRSAVKRKNYRLNDRDHAQLSELYENGYHPLEIAEVMKISDKTVYKFCSDKFSPSSGWARGAPSYEERELIMKRYSLGVSISMLAAAHRRPIWVIYRILNPKPSGIASIPGAPLKVVPVGSTVAKPHEDEGMLARIGSFFRRLFGGSH